MSEELDGTLGRAVRELRIAQGLSQEKLASRAGLSRRHLAALESGANVTVLRVLRVARALGAPQLLLGEIAVTSTVAAAPRISDALEALADIERRAADARRALEAGRT